MLAAILGFSGCAANTSIEKLADDSYALDCSGGPRTWAGCHDLAKTACGTPNFEIQSQVTNDGSATVGLNDWSVAGSQITRIMVVKCK